MPISASGLVNFDVLDRVQRPTSTMVRMHISRERFTVPLTLVPLCVFGYSGHTVWQFFFEARSLPRAVFEACSLTAS